MRRQRRKQLKSSLLPQLESSLELILASTQPFETKMMIKDSIGTGMEAQFRPKSFHPSRTLFLHCNYIATRVHSFFSITVTTASYCVCRMLHTAAEEGDFTQADNVLKQMNENSQLPGPKAYHALVFSYVKGGYARGALNAIRTEVGKGNLQLWETLPLCIDLPDNKLKYIIEVLI